MTSDLKAKTVRGVGWSAIQSWGIRLVSFLVYPVLARILGPETYGLIALAGVYISILDIFSDVSFGAAIEQRHTLEPEHLDSIFWAFLGLGLLLTTMSMVGAPLVARFFDEPGLTQVVRWLSLGFMLQMVCGVQTSLMRRELKIRQLAGYHLSAAVAGGISGIVMAFTGFGVWSLVAQRLIIQIVVMVMLWRGSTWRPRALFSPAHFRQVSSFGLYILGGRILNYLNRHFDQLLIGKYLGRVDLGFYFNASRLENLATTMFIGAISQVVMPALSRLQQELPRFRRAYIKACRFTTLIAFPVFVGISVLAEELIVVVLGAQWAPSVPALRLLALVGLIHSLQYINGATMMALGRADLRLVVQILHTAVNVTGFLFVVRYGFVAVAGAYTARAYLLAPIDFLVIRRLGALSFRQLARAIWAQVVASVLMGGLLLYLRATVLVGVSPLWILVGCSAAGFFVYGACCLALDRSLVSECRDLWSILLPRRAGTAGEKS